MKKLNLTYWVLASLMMFALGSWQLACNRSSSEAPEETTVESSEPEATPDGENATPEQPVAQEKSSAEGQGNSSTDSVEESKHQKEAKESQDDEKVDNVKEAFQYTGKEMEKGFKKTGKSIKKAFVGDD